MEAVEKENSLVAKPKHWVRATREFFRDVSAEMKKVTWPSRNEVVGTTVVVIIATLIFSLYLGACDVIFYRAINYLFTRFGAGA